MTTTSELGPTPSTDPAAGVMAVAAVDIGASKTLVTVRTLPLEDRWKVGDKAVLKFPTARDPGTALDEIAAAIRCLTGSMGIDESAQVSLVAVGCAAPGPLDPETGIIRNSPNLGWRDMPLGEHIGARLGVPWIVDDDAHLGALGEAVMGVGRGARAVAYLTVSSGIGSGLAIDGRIHRGDHGFAGEVGHLTVDPAGPRCGCGRRGDVEAFSGGRSLARRARMAWPARRRSDGSLAPRDADALFAAAAAGDHTAIRLMEDATEALGRAIASIAAALDPGVIAIGGSIGLGQPRFIRAAVRRARRRAMSETGRTLIARPAALGGESVLAGAAVAAAALAERGAVKIAAGTVGFDRTIGGDAQRGPFRDDIRIQGSTVRGIAVDSSRDAVLREQVRRGVRLLGDGNEPLVFIGMGSSLHAARTALSRFAQIGRFAVAQDAGELLHFGLAGLPSRARVIAISQSGRSAETVAVVERLRAADADRDILAIVNDLDSPLATLASVAVPLQAGVESAVATRTFVATAVILQLLADGLASASTAQAGLGSLAAVLDQLSVEDGAARRAADLFASVRSLELVGRGATLGIAHYGALTIKETAAFPAEALSGGAFRHGPLELVDAPAGAVILVPPGPTAGLAMRLAQEIAESGWPTWAIGPEGLVQQLETDRVVASWGARLVVTGVPGRHGPLAAIPLVVPLQQFAAVLAERFGRVPGILLRGTKITETQ